mgnify:CR=1 FL=1
MKKLGVNIDHVATLRNARGENHPYPDLIAKKVIRYGADSITIHLREDRRHINDKDIKNLKMHQKLPLNLEMAVTEEMQKIALRTLPNAVCLVPEKREERTTEGGLKVDENKKSLKNFVLPLKSSGIRISLFIEPDMKKLLSVPANVGKLPSAPDPIRTDPVIANAVEFDPATFN